MRIKQETEDPPVFGLWILEDATYGMEAVFKCDHKCSDDD